MNPKIRENSLRSSVKLLILFIFVSLIYMMQPFFIQKVFAQQPVKNPQGEETLNQRFSRALELENESKYMEAIFEYKSLLQENPYFFDVKIGLARCYYKTGNFEDARDILLEALEQESRDITGLNLLGRVYIALGQLDEAEKVFKRALELSPSNIETWYGLAQLYRKNGQYKKAVEMYQKLLKIYPNEFWTYIHLANSYMEMGEYQKAGGFFRKAVSLNSQDPFGHLNLGYYYIKMGILKAVTGSEIAEKFFDAALYELKIAEKLNKNIPEVYRAKADTYLFTGRYKNAAKNLKKLIELSGREPLVLNDLAYCLEKIKKYEEAITIYSEAMIKKPDDEIIRFRNEEVVLGVYKTSLSNPIRKKLAEHHGEKGKFFMHQSIFNRAMIHYRRAIQLDPLNPNYRLSLAEIYRLKGFKERYLFLLKNIIKQALNVNTVEINDLIEIYQSYLAKSVSARWKVSPYLEKPENESYIPGSKTKILITNGFSLDYFNHKFYHWNLPESFSKILWYTLNQYDKIEPVFDETQVKTPQDAFRLAYKKKVDYYITGRIIETSDTIEIYTSIFSANNGKLMKTIHTYFTGNNRVYSSALSIGISINDFVPLKGLLVRLRGDRGLINLGLAHGVSKDMEFDIIREGGIRIDPSTGEYTYSKDMILGKIKITDTDEMVSEGIVKQQGVFNRINVGDTVILSKKKTTGKEIIQKTE